MTRGRTLIAALAGLAASASAAAQDLQACHILAVDQWVAVGVTSQQGCLELAKSAALPNEWQHARHGRTDLAVMNGRFYRSHGGGWQSIGGSSRGASLGALNVLQAPDEWSAPPEFEAAPPPAAPPDEPSAPQVFTGPAPRTPQDSGGRAPAAPVAPSPELGAAPAPAAPTAPPSSYSGATADCETRDAEGWLVAKCPR